MSVSNPILIVIKTCYCNKLYTIDLYHADLAELVRPKSRKLAYMHIYRLQQPADCHLMEITCLVYRFIGPVAGRLTATE